MTYVSALEEREVFNALRAKLVKAGLSYRQLFWATGIIAFSLSPVTDNLTTAIILGAAAIAVSAGNTAFVAISCVNIVVASNAGGTFSPFGDITTLMVWQSGRVKVGDSDFVLADIPGLIEGAHMGQGLGDRFLGHVERTAVLLHLIDSTQDDIVKAYETIRNELHEYGAGVEEKDEIIAINKIDALGDELAADQARILEEAIGKPVHLVSAVSGRGVKEILFALAGKISQFRAEERASKAASYE